MKDERRVEQRYGRGKSEREMEKDGRGGGRRGKVEGVAPASVPRSPCRHCTARAPVRLSNVNCIATSLVYYYTYLLEEHCTLSVVF